MKHAFAAYVLSASAALAHEGHEAAVTQGDLHWLTQPDHLVVLALGAAVAALTVMRVVRERRREDRRHV